MKALLIENQFLADQIARDLSNIEVFLADECNSLEALADAIPDNYDIYIIHANVRIGNGSCVANSGIKLLKLLRLRHINSHVMIYSWLNKEALMKQDVRNAILFTQGVSFYRLPDFLDVLQSINLEKLSKITADRQELIQLFRAEYNPDNRHFNANIIGAWQLMRVQDAYEEISGIQSGTSNSENQDTDYDKSRGQILNYLNSYNGRLVQYLGNYCSVESMKAILRDEINAHDRKAILDAGKQAVEAIEGVDRTISELDIQIKSLQSLLISDQKAPEQQGLFDTILRKFDIISDRAERKMNERVHDAIDKLKEQKARHERERRQWSWKKVRSEQLSGDSNIVRDNHEDVNDLDADLLKEKLSALRTNKPRIIYVDDMAEEGWACILRRIVYGDNTDCYNRLTPIIPQKEDTPESIVKKIQEANLFEADMLILDLRLKDERGFVDPSELSGFRVLELLREKYLSCPIMIITASNKVWSLKEAFNENVVSFWIKAGMEQYDNENAFVKSYINLVDLIYSLTTNKWIFDALSTVKKMTVAIENAETSGFWWESKRVEFQAGTVHRKLTDRQDVIRILNRAASITQNNLRQCYFGMGNMAFSDVCRLFVTEIHFVMEEITHLDTEHIDFSLSKKLEVCGKQCDIVAGHNFLGARNQIIHQGLIPGKNEVNTYLKGVLMWILETPSNKIAGKLSRKQPVVVPVNGIDITPDEKVAITYYGGREMQEIIMDKNTEISQKVEKGDYIMVSQYKANNSQFLNREILEYFKVQ